VAESTVFGAVAGETAARDAREVGLPQLDPAYATEIEQRHRRPWQLRPRGEEVFTEPVRFKRMSQPSRTRAVAV
jgi:succinate dehydrogenase/fumarate reductase flavoprotein subunit